MSGLQPAGADLSTEFRAHEWVRRVLKAVRFLSYLRPGLQYQQTEHVRGRSHQQAQPDGFHGHVSRQQIDQSTGTSAHRQTLGSRELKRDSGRTPVLSAVDPMQRKDRGLVHRDLLLQYETHLR